PQQHPRIHGIPVAILHIRAFHHELLTLFIHFSLHAAYALGMPVSRAVSLPTQRSLYTVLRGPFVHKKSQENFERVVHKRAIKVWDTDPDVLSKWIRYLEINMMPGIGIRVVRWERAEVGFGAKKLQGIRDAQSELFKSREKFDLDTSSGRVKALADQIIKAEMASA
ncbi:ribosomal protein S10 domain-containing protein, partial [Cantharellus anzutake]